MTEESARRRTIRSFVRRTGRITLSQQRALDESWPQYGIDSADLLDLDEVFGRRADRVLEIGFGNGENLVSVATDQPEKDFLGIEVHPPGIGHCLIEARERGITNLRIIARDALEVMEQQLAQDSLAAISLLFPDPWPKKRHHKRRIVQRPFVALAGQTLMPQGLLRIATDWMEYAEHIDEVMGAAAEFQLVERRIHRGDRPLDRYTTRFETRGVKRGHDIVDWKFRRAI